MRLSIYNIWDCTAFVPFPFWSVYLSLGRKQLYTLVFNISSFQFSLWSASPSGLRLRWESPLPAEIPRPPAGGAAAVGLCISWVLTVFCHWFVHTSWLGTADSHLHNFLYWLSSIIIIIVTHLYRSFLSYVKPELRNNKFLLHLHKMLYDFGYLVVLLLLSVKLVDLIGQIDSICPPLQ